MHMTETTDTDFLDEGFFPTLIPYKTNQARNFRYNHRIFIFEDKIQTREELRTLFMRYNLTFEINFTYEKLIEHLIKTDKIDNNVDANLQIARMYEDNDMNDKAEMHYKMACFCICNAEFFHFIFQKKIKQFEHL